MRPSKVTQDKMQGVPERPLFLRLRYQRFVRYGLTAVLALLVGGLLWWQFLPTPIEHGMVLQSPQPATNFTLTGSGNTAVSLRDFRGKYMLLNFGYTSCPDVCPMTLAELTQAMDVLGERADGVAVLFVSLDPQRDAPERLQQYLSYFHPTFVGVSGSEEDVMIAATQFGVFFQKHAAKEDGSYFIDHTAQVTVIDPHGYVRLVFPNGTTGEEMAEDLLALGVR